jgi:hypothetical protein
MSIPTPAPVVFETFAHTQDINRLVRSHQKDKPSHVNNEICVQRYRVTIELIEESDEVIRDRLLALDEERGHCDKARAIRTEAKRLGIDLKKH